MKSQGKEYFGYTFLVYPIQIFNVMLTITAIIIGYFTLITLFFFFWPRYDNMTIHQPFWILFDVKDTICGI